MSVKDVCELGALLNAEDSDRENLTTELLRLEADLKVAKSRLQTEKALCLEKAKELQNIEENRHTEDQLNILVAAANQLAINEGNSSSAMKEDIKVRHDDFLLSQDRIICALANLENEILMLEAEVLDRKKVEETQSISVLSADLDLQISSLREDIEHKQNTLESHSKELERIQGQQLVLDEEIKSLSESLRVMSDAIATTDIDIQTMNDEHVLFLSRTELEILESTKTLNSVNEAISSLEKEYVSRQQHLQDAESLLENVRSKKDLALSLIKSHDAEIDAMQALRADIKTQTSDVKLEIKSLEKVVLDLKHISLISAAWISSKEANILLMKEDFNKLAEEVRVSSDAVSDAAEKASQIHIYLQQLELEIKNKQNAFDCDMILAKNKYEERKKRLEDLKIHNERTNELIEIGTKDLEKSTLEHIAIENSIIFIKSMILDNEEKIRELNLHLSDVGQFESDKIRANSRSTDIFNEIASVDVDIIHLQSEKRNRSEILNNLSDETTKEKDEEYIRSLVDETHMVLSKAPLVTSLTSEKARLEEELARKDKLFQDKISSSQELFATKKSELIACLKEIDSKIAERKSLNSSTNAISKAPIPTAVISTTKEITTVVKTPKVVKKAATQISEKRPAIIGNMKKPKITVSPSLTGSFAYSATAADELVVKLTESHNSPGYNLNSQHHPPQALDTTSAFASKRIFKRRLA